MFVKVYNRDCFCNMDSIKYIKIENHSKTNHLYSVIAFVLIGTCLQDEVIGEFSNHDEALEYVQTLIQLSCGDNL